MNTTASYTHTLLRTTTPFHLEGLSDTMLDYKLRAVEANITHYIRQFGYWVSECETWTGIATENALVPTILERMDANETLAQANINAWYAIMGEMVMRRFRENGYYADPSFNLEAYVDSRKQSGSVITRTNVTFH